MTNRLMSQRDYVSIEARTVLQRLATDGAARDPLWRLCELDIAIAEYEDSGGAPVAYYEARKALAAEIRQPFGCDGAAP